MHQVNLIFKNMSVIPLVIGYAFVNFRSVENRVWISVKPRSKYNTYSLHFILYIIFYSILYSLKNNHTFVKKSNIHILHFIFV